MKLFIYLFVGVAKIVTNNKRTNKSHAKFIAGTLINTLNPTPVTCLARAKPFPAAEANGPLEVIYSFDSQMMTGILIGNNWGERVFV